MSLFILASFIDLLIVANLDSNLDKRPWFKESFRNKSACSYNYLFSESLYS